MNWTLFLGIVTFGNIYMIYKLCHKAEQHDDLFFKLGDTLTNILKYLDEEKNKK